MNFSSSFCALVTVFVLILCVHEGVAIKCWVCRSDFDPKCGEPFDNSTLPISNCRYQLELDHLSGIIPTMCERIRSKVNGEWQYSRSCAYGVEPGIARDEEVCVMRTGADNIQEEYCTCNSKDGCNAAPLTYSNHMLILFVAVVTCYVTSSYSS